MTKDAAASWFGAPSAPGFHFNSRRSAVFGRGGMVAASQPLAVAAGLRMLSQGGSAADAAIATAAVLNVCEPTSTGIGGDCFALYYEAASRQVSALNGSGRSAAALSLERLAQDGLHELPAYHPYTVTVPGACAGWCDLLERFGRLSLGQVLEPAVHLAEEGFPVAPLTAQFWARGAERQLRQAPNGVELTVEGRAPRPGELFRNPGLARTLRRVAEGGKAAFYQGEIAEGIVQVLRQAGGGQGCLSLDDLAAHHSTWDQPIHTTYHGLRVWECPPNGQGLAALLALNILEGFNLHHSAPLSVERLHLQIEAMRLAFADARWYVSDPAFSNLPLADLLSKAYAEVRRRQIDPRRAMLDQTRGTPHAASDTVYFCVMDSEGNACSFINSNYMGFGTGIVPAGWGFSLQNRGHNFSLQADHPNALAPRKRPYHTIIPGLLTYAEPVDSSGEPREPLCGPFGVMGGFMQPQGHVQVVSALIDDHLDPQAALDRPRYCIEDGTAGGTVALEEGITENTLLHLAEMGHPVRPVRGMEQALFGRGQVILRQPETGILAGGSDPRADGCVMSL